MRAATAATAAELVAVGVTAKDAASVASATVALAVAAEPTSPYVEMFKTEQLGPGARSGKIAFFPAHKDKNIEGKAKTRTMAVVRHLHEDEVREIYLKECAYLEALEARVRARSEANGMERR